jgi:hypothetical protein
VKMLYSSIVGVYEEVRGLVTKLTVEVFDAF